METSIRPSQKIQLLDYANMILVKPPSTTHLCPWKLVYAEEFLSKSEALIREKNLKKVTRESIIALLARNKNIVNLFGSVG